MEERLGVRRQRRRPGAGQPRRPVLAVARGVHPSCIPPAFTGRGPRTVDATDHTGIDGLVLPGGVADPDFLRTDPGTLAFARSFFDAGKPVAVICHGPWTLIEADVVRGRTVTSWPSLRTDLRNAGATWVDEEVKVCEDGPDTLVSSRRPDDLKAFCQAAVEASER
ncbi:DJ-1/PfpI family protein [Spirillospora sp. CA-108201]